MTLILASQSPRRKEILQSLGVEFITRPANIDETPYEKELPSTYVCRMAMEKANRVLTELDQPSESYVLGSDTIVVVDSDSSGGGGASEILGKPIDYADFQRMMKLLSGRTHRTMTAVSLMSNSVHHHDLVTTSVSFMSLSESQIAAYWQTGEPVDKAGGYGIQGKGGVFVSAIEGSFSAVVGLPLHQTATLLARAGLPIWQGELLIK